MRLDPVAQALPQGLILASVDGTIIDRNAALSELLAEVPGEGTLEGRHILDLVSSSDKQAVFREGVPALLEGKLAVARATWLFTRSDGESVPADVTLAVLRDEAKRPAALLVTVLDARRRIEAEQKIISEIAERLMADVLERRAQQDFLVATLQHMPAGVVIVDRQSRRLSLANEGIRALVGQPLAERLAGGDLTSVPFVREDGSPYPADRLPLAQTLATGQPCVTDDVWLRRADGARVPLHCRSGTISVENRDAAVLVVEDTSVLRNQERRSVRVEARYRALFEQATDAVFLASDGLKRVVEANAAAKRLFAFKPETETGVDRNTLGVFKAELLDGRVLAHLLAEQVAIANRDGVARFPLSGQTSEENHVELELSLQPLRFEEGPDLLLVSARDLTRQKLLEREVQHSQKIGSIGLLAGGIAHDFNNLISTVMGYLELATEAVPLTGPGSEARDLLVEAAETAQRGAELARQILAFTRKSSPVPSPIDLNKIVQRTVSLIRRAFGGAVVVETKPVEGGAVVNGNASDLEQLLLNLALNARNAMPQGGRLTVETRREAMPRQLVNSNLPPGPHVLLVISDTGAGMSDEVQKNLFRPFFSTKPDDRGPGLGLALVQGIIERHNAEVFVESAPGQGTRFTIAFPCVKNGT